MQFKHIGFRVFLIVVAGYAIYSASYWSFKTGYLSLSKSTESGKLAQIHSFDGNGMGIFLCRFPTDRAATVRARSDSKLDGLVRLAAMIREYGFENYEGAKVAIDSMQ